MLHIDLGLTCVASCLELHALSHPYVAVSTVAQGGHGLPGWKTGTVGVATHAERQL